MVYINFSDHDFTVNLNHIMDFIEKFQTHLNINTIFKKRPIHMQFALLTGLNHFIFESPTKIYPTLSFVVVHISLCLHKRAGYLDHPLT